MTIKLYQKQHHNNTLTTKMYHTGKQATQKYPIRTTALITNLYKKYIRKPALLTTNLYKEPYKNRRVDNKAIPPYWQKTIQRIASEPPHWQLDKTIQRTDNKYMQRTASESQHWRQSCIDKHPAFQICQNIIIKMKLHLMKWNRQKRSILGT